MVNLRVNKVLRFGNQGVANAAKPIAAQSKRWKFAKPSAGPWLLLLRLNHIKAPLRREPSLEWEACGTDYGD